MAEHSPRVLAIDAGGTMTDTFIVDEAGSFVVGTRTVRWQDGNAETDIIRLEDVDAGHGIEGPAIVEHVATTFAIPPGRTARLDRHGIFHLSASG